MKNKEYNSRIKNLTESFIKFTTEEAREELQKSNRRFFIKTILAGYIAYIASLFPGLCAITGCTKNNNFVNPFNPVSEQEARDFGKLVVEDINIGKKDTILNAGIDPAAPRALCELIGKDCPKELENPTSEEIKFYQTYTLETHKTFYKKTKRAELVSVKPIGSTFQITIRFDTTTLFDKDNSNTENTFVIGKNKHSGKIEILTAGHSL